MRPAATRLRHYCRADGPYPPTSPGRMITRSYLICQAAQVPPRALGDLPLHTLRRPRRPLPRPKKAAARREKTGRRLYHALRSGTGPSGARELAAHSFEGQTQLEQGLALELPDPLLAELQDSRHRLERQLAAVAHPEPSLENVAFPRRELAQ